MVQLPSIKKLPFRTPIGVRSVEFENITPVTLEWYENITQSLNAQNTFFLYSSNTGTNHKEYQKKINGLCYYMIQKQDFKNLPTLQANQKELIRCKQKITNDPTKYDPNESSINFTLGVIDSALKILDSNTDNNNIIKDDNDAHN